MRHSQGILRLVEELESVLVDNAEPREMFLEFTRHLEREYDIAKGLLVLKENDKTRFLAVASWNHGKTRKNLSLLLPSTGSLFEKVAEQGQIYTDNFAELYDGNQMEKRLLLDDYTQSFMLRPLKHDATIVGLLGYSSENTDAFVTFEEGLLDPVIDHFAAVIAQFQLTQQQ
ncbi:MAG: hypothetical protein DRP45_07520 [Candidatus Zixiibacteriota bacterium]|nr:MAG: hypothetical protein DRP45_07520 [candidate division Zixibacteria bacterium]